MPKYLYRCDICKDEVYRSHSAETNMRFTHDKKCGGHYYKIPQMVSVVWGGLKPSDGELAPAAQEWLGDLPRLKDEFAEKKENHVNRTTVHDPSKIKD